MSAGVLARVPARLTRIPIGAGPLDELLADPAVTDIVVNGPDEVWLDRGAGLEPTGVRFPDADALRRIAQRLAAASGRRIDDASPFVDVRLPDGTRLHAVLPPVAVGGPYLSLRTFRARAFSLAELVGAGTLEPEAAWLLTNVIRARLSYVVSGGAGSGKTTLLAALLGLVPGNERIVIVEDATELHPQHPHVVSLQSRMANVEGAGAVSLRELVRQALRMRPDRLVVGECRGGEVVDLLGALNTGHDGGAVTLHANTAGDVPARLEALGLLGGVGREALHAQLAAGLQAVLHLGRDDRLRVLEEVCLLVPGERPGLVRAETAWRRHLGPGPAASRLSRLLLARGVPPSAIGFGS
jgi:pilus assembly protein CpaF